MLYFRGGAFVVSFFPLVPCLCANSRLRPGPLIRLTHRHLIPKIRPNIPSLSPEYCRLNTGSVLDPLSPETRSQVR